MHILPIMHSTNPTLLLCYRDAPTTDFTKQLADIEIHKIACTNSQAYSLLFLKLYWKQRL